MASNSNEQFYFLPKLLLLLKITRMKFIEFIADVSVLFSDNIVVDFSRNRCLRNLIFIKVLLCHNTAFVNIHKTYFFLPFSYILPHHCCYFSETSHELNRLWSCFIISHISLTYPKSVPWGMG